MYLLDTNLISEFIKTKRCQSVIDWCRVQDPRDLFLSVLTLGEIRRGIEILEPSRRRASIVSWLEEDLQKQFEGRILPVDAAIADRWGYIMPKCREHTVDRLLAATALVHNLTLVSRNRKDFGSIPGLKCVNPWE